MKCSIFSHTQASYAEAIGEQLGKGKQHAAQLYSQWFRFGHVRPLESWVEPQAMALVRQIQDKTDFSIPAVSQIQEADRIVKFLLRFSDELESESVLIPMRSGTTLCLSSQIGCKMGCAFCATGKMGLVRHLTAEEMVAQVFCAKFILKNSVRNVVFMGMGEPFDNYDAVMNAVRILTDPAGLGLGLRRITISTSGHVEGLLRMAKSAPAALNLAVSLNAPTDALRQRLMPVNRLWNLATLKEAMLCYCERGNREILIGYVLLKGINDSLECAHALASYLQGLRVKINLIPYNSQPREGFSSPEEAQKELFLQTLRSLGYSTLLRGTKGNQIQAACGQLGNRKARSR